MARGPQIGMDIVLRSSGGKVRVNGRGLNVILDVNARVRGTIAQPQLTGGVGAPRPEAVSGIQGKGVGTSSAAGREARHASKAGRRCVVRARLARRQAPAIQTAVTRQRQREELTAAQLRERGNPRHGLRPFMHDVRETAANACAVGAPDVSPAALIEAQARPGTGGDLSQARGRPHHHGHPRCGRRNANAGRSAARARRGPDPSPDA